MKDRIKNKIKQLVGLQGSVESNSKAQYPVDFTNEEIEIINFCRDFTMTSDERMVALIRSVDYIAQGKIQGDIVECGVWRGGSMMAVAKRLISLNDQERTLFLYDTFEGMPESSDVDRRYDNTPAQEFFEKEKGGWCYASQEDVETNLKSTHYDVSRLKFIKGKVEETLPNNSIDKIAILRLDTDWYESTKIELEHLYDRLTPNGILIIDDYGHWTGAKKAVDEFFKNRKINVFLNRIDYTGRLLVKPL